MKKKMLLIPLAVLTASLMLFSCGDNVFDFLADDDSTEAKQYEVTKNLDQGNWDAVIGSPYATHMQKGAAYFGKAGFDTKDVVNGLIDANTNNAGDSDLNLYMTSLVKTVTNNSLSNLDSSDNEYDLAIQFEPGYAKDANFYKSLVNIMKALSIIKTLIDGDGDGNLTTCNINENNNNDDADAASCSLRASISQPCTKNSVTYATYDPATPSNMTLSDPSGNPLAGNYSGLTVSIIEITPSAGCPTDYKKLLYQTDVANNIWVVVATTSEQCGGSDGNTWPCPILNSDGTPVEFVEAVTMSLNSSTDALQSSLTGTSDVSTSVEDVKAGACGPVDPDVCTTDELSDYMLTI